MPSTALAAVLIVATLAPSAAHADVPPPPPPAYEAEKAPQQQSAGSAVHLPAASLAKLVKLLDLIDIDENSDIVVKGANVRIVNGAGSTYAQPNGKGNLILGYDATARTVSIDRQGSHNVVVGDNHEYPASGSIVSGRGNALRADASAILGGEGISCAAPLAATLGGRSLRLSPTATASAAVAGISNEVHSPTSAAIAGKHNRIHEGAQASAAAGGVALQVTRTEAAGVLARPPTPEVEALLQRVSVDAAGDVVVSGANLKVQSGAGSTHAATNGKGNLIVGYNEGGNSTAGAPDRSGSHNIVVGMLHGYSATGGIVTGKENSVRAAGAACIGGEGNIADAAGATVVGGNVNTASGAQSAVVGGLLHAAQNQHETVIGTVKAPTQEIEMSLNERV